MAEHTHCLTTTARADSSQLDALPVLIQGLIKHHEEDDECNTTL